MSQTFTLRIPKQLSVATRMTEPEITKELAIHLYQLRKLSIGKACELSGLSRITFQQLLASRKIPINYGVDDYQEDVKTLKRLRRI